MYREAQFDFVYHAMYSPRPGTIATKCFPDDVPKEEKHRRWHALNDLLIEISAQKLAQEVGHTHEVLIERHNPQTGLISGRTRWYTEVVCSGDASHVGQFVSVHIDRASDLQLFGTLVSADSPSHVK